MVPTTFFSVRCKKWKNTHLIAAVFPKWPNFSNFKSICFSKFNTLKKLPSIYSQIDSFIPTLIVWTPPYIDKGVTPLPLPGMPQLCFSCFTVMFLILLKYLSYSMVWWYPFLSPFCLSIYVTFSRSSIKYSTYTSFCWTLLAF